MKLLLLALVLSFSFVSGSIIAKQKIPEAYSDSQSTLIKKIGSGTWSKVYLCQKASGELFVMKKYCVKDEEEIAFLKENGLIPEVFTHYLGNKEEKIGQLSNHPNIVKIEQVVYEPDVAYVFMEFVEGETLGYFTSYSKESRHALVEQFLSAFEHLVSRNIILDDLWSENFILSEDGHLTLIDLGGFDFFGDEFAEEAMSVKHYLHQIEHMIIQLGGDDGNKAIAECSQIIPKALRKEKLNLLHKECLLLWSASIRECMKAKLTFR